MSLKATGIEADLLALHGIDILAVIQKQEADGQVVLAYQLIFG
jgi:hypothetical protein